MVEKNLRSGVALLPGNLLPSGNYPKRCKKNILVLEEKDFSQKSVIYPGSLEDSWTVWKTSGQSGTFLDSLEDFLTVGRFPDSQEIL